MDLFHIMAIVSCVTSTMTMIVVCIALLPHVKNGMVIVRDAILWIALVVLVIGMAWGLVNNRRGNDSRSDSSPLINPIKLVSDRYYAGK